jgi:signal transduction histidine kinase
VQTARDEALDAAAAKDRFVVVAAHELRQPLAAMMIQADLLRRLAVQRQDAPLMELAEDLRATLHRQGRLVADLLDVSRARVGKLPLELEQVELGALVARVATSMAETLPSVQLRLDIAPPETLRCRADGVRVEQILSNLMDNALKCVGTQGVIDVRVVAEGDFARISVLDNGRGMAPEKVARLFPSPDEEPVRRIVPGESDTGLGIGLALVSELVNAHGGRARARSEGVGKGAEFTVWLPLSATDRYVQAHETATCLDRPVRQPRGRSPCSTSSCRPPSKATATIGTSGASVT